MLRLLLGRRFKYPPLTHCTKTRHRVMSTATETGLPTQPLQAALNKVTGGNTFQQKDVRDLAGRVAVVTGGTAGIGYEVAKCLALAGARVVVLSRKAHNGEKAISQIKTLAAENETNTVDVDCEFVECDFGNMKIVKEVADKLIKQEKRLDIVRNGDETCVW